MQHQDAYNLLSTIHFGFRYKRPISDLQLLLRQEWRDNLDQDLDITGGFHRVWHKGLLMKFRTRVIQGDLLDLLNYYITGRTLNVVISGQTSHQFSVGASVHQGSVFGPILWRIFVDDLLKLHSELSAYADECTLTTKISKTTLSTSREPCGKSISLLRKRFHFSITSRY